VSATRGFVKIGGVTDTSITPNERITMSLHLKKLNQWLLCLFLGGVFHAAFAQVDSQPMGVVGKDEWLFFRFDYTDVNDEKATTTSIDLIQRFNKVLAQNGVTMAFVMVPIKARIYSEHLPDSAPITPYMIKNYDRLLRELSAAKVNVIDLNQPFMTSKKRNTETPFFFRLDTHWSPSGAMLAAEAVRDQINTNRLLLNAMNTVSAEPYSLNWERRKRCSPELRGLVEHLPKGSPSFGDEHLVPFVVKSGRNTGGLLDESSNAKVVLMGSSYSAQCYQFPDALRYTLQRNLLAVSVVAQHGAWEGIETYLRDDAFQTNRPKLLIWEIPERDMRSPPDFKFREARYQSDNTEWLLRASAWAQSGCVPSIVKARIVAAGLLATPAEQVTVGRTTDKDFIEIQFSKPISKLDYLMANVITGGSKKLVFEASGVGVETRWIDVVVSGDGSPHVLKTPLPSRGKGFTKLRIFPGRTSSFVFNDLQVCRQPEDLLR
jgi:alginate O-acetyltransferase complex protein AlgJ